MTGAPYLPGFGRWGIPRLSADRSLPATNLEVHGIDALHSQGLRFVESHICQNRADTPNFLYAALERTACAPFFKERRMKSREPTKLHRKSGVWGTRALSQTGVSRLGIGMSPGRFTPPESVHKKNVGRAEALPTYEEVTSSVRTGGEG